MRVELCCEVLLADQNLLFDSENGTNAYPLGGKKGSVSEGP